MADRNIRQAHANDVPELAELDLVAQRDSSRRDFIRNAVERGSCWVVENSDRIIGYGVISHGFFGRSFIELIYFVEHYRSCGHGSGLLVFLESQSKSRDIFTSTNESNSHMQHVLKNLGYERSGNIYNLDPDDPEVVYYKRLVCD